MQAFIKLLMRYISSFLIGSAIIVGAGQVLSVPAANPVSQGIGRFIDQYPALDATSRWLDETLTFTNGRGKDSDSRPANQAAPFETAAPVDRGPLDDLRSGAAGTSSRDRLPLELDGVAALSPGNSWGFVNRDQARCFTAEGKQQARLKAGRPVVVGNVQKTSAGECIVCRTYPEVQGEKPYLLLASDVLLLEGAPGSIPSDIFELFRAKAQAQADIARFEADLLKNAQAKNPHFPRFRKAYSTYKDYWSRVKALQAKRDQGTGGMQASDELRRLKGKDVQIGREFETAKRDYEAWKKNNPPPSPTTYPEYRALLKKLDDIDDQLKNRPDWSS